MSGNRKARKSELEALQLPFYVDPGTNKVGRRTRNSRVSKAASASATAAGIATGTRRKWAAAIEKFSKPQPGYPRFLFRGIRPNSGGGAKVSEKLNTAEGVVPHAFAACEDYGLFDTPNLRQVVNAHLAGSHAGNSPFSSWTPSMGVAMKYTTEDGRLAMLDTTLLNHKEESESASTISDPSMVFHVPDLVKTKMALVSDDTEFDYEFLVYRPAIKPAFRSVGLGEIRDAGWDYKHRHHGRNSYSNKNKDDDGPDHIREEDVAVARAVAELYRQQDANRNNSPAVALNVTAAFLSVQYHWKEELDEEDLQVLARLLAADLEAWRASGEEAPLVNPEQFTKGMYDAKFMVRMLVDMQKQPPPTQPEPEHEPEHEPEPEPESEPESKKRKREDDDDGDNADEELQPPGPKRQCEVTNVEPIRGRPRTWVLRKLPKARAKAVKSDSDPDL
ncbi:hypothetical protein PG988_013349 [Apiospora saccharicola]